MQVLIVQNGAVLVYFQEKDYWHSPPIDPEGYWSEYFDVRIVHEMSEIATYLPPDRSQCIFVGESIDDAHAMGIERCNPKSVMNILHFARGVKTGYEIECMRQASRRGAAGHIAAEQAFRDEMPEFDIHLAYCNDGAALVSHKAAGIMHLHTEQVAEAMRKKC